jgi:hypothetical protein
MAKRTLTRAVKLTGTDVAEGKRRTLTAGPITAMFDNGALRYIRYRGAEVLRGIAYLVRDKDWRRACTTWQRSRPAPRAR